MNYFGHDTVDGLWKPKIELGINLPWEIRTKQGGFFDYPSCEYIRLNDDSVSFKPVNSRLIINDSLIYPISVYYARQKSESIKEARPKNPGTANTGKGTNECDRLNDYSIYQTMLFGLKGYRSDPWDPNIISTITVVLDSVMYNGRNIYIEPLRIKVVNSRD